MHNLTLVAIVSLAACSAVQAQIGSKPNGSGATAPAVQQSLATCGPCKCDRTTLYCAAAEDGTFTPSTQYFGQVQNIFLRGDLCGRADAVAPAMQRVYPDAHIRCDDWWLALRAITRGTGGLPTPAPPVTGGTSDGGGTEPSPGGDERLDAMLLRLDEISRQMETLANNQRVIYNAIIEQGGGGAAASLAASLDGDGDQWDKADQRAEKDGGGYQSLYKWSQLQKN